MDEVRHFWITFGDIVDAAALAHSVVRVVTFDGRVIEGVPDRPAGIAAPEAALDGTSMPRTVVVGDESVEVEDVREVTLKRPFVAPDAPPPS